MAWGTLDMEHMHALSMGFLQFRIGGIPTVPACLGPAMARLGQPWRDWADGIWTSEHGQESSIGL